MAGDRPRICVALVGDDIETIHAAAPFADLFEVRIDLIGEVWPDVVSYLDKPWLATNRLTAEGGAWQGTEQARIDELMKALSLGASIIDIELAAPDVKNVIKEIKKSARCLVSHHDFQKTPPCEALTDIVARQKDAGADICKLVTTAGSMTDNLNILRLVRETWDTNIVSFCMGVTGQISRILSPLAGAYFTFASANTGRESAPGQLSAAELHDIYGVLGYDS